MSSVRRQPGLGERTRRGVGPALLAVLVAGLPAPAVAGPVKAATAAADDEEEVAAKPGLALVRLVSSQNVPDGWLELERRITAILVSRGLAVTAPVKAAEALKATGNRFDRAVERLEQAIMAAEGAHGRHAEKDAQRELKDADDLLALGGVVAIVPAELLVRFHQIRARVAAAQKASEARRAAVELVSLVGVSLADDGSLDELALPAPDAGGKATLTVEASPSNAVILVDGRPIGTGTVRRFELAATRHYLRIIAPGREAFGERLQLKPGENARREPRLSPLVDPLVSTAGDAALDPVPKAEVETLSTLREALDVGTLVILMPGDSRSLKLRSFATAGRGFLPVVSVPFDSAGDALAGLLDAALGRRAPLAVQPILAAPVSSDTRPTAVSQPAPDLDAAPGGPAPGPASGNFDTRWLWAGGGAVVVIAGIVTAVIVSQSSNGPGKATVWLCPGREACAP